MNMQKFLFLPLTFLFSMSCFASNFSNLSFNKIYSDMHGVCENFKEKSWVSTCDNLNECETVLKTKKNELSNNEYSDYVNKWNTTLAAFDIYSVCRVLKEKTDCIKVDCLNASVKEVQSNINKCSGLSKKCSDWFSGNELETDKMKITSDVKLEVTDSKYYKERYGIDAKKGDTFYRLSFFMNSKYIDGLHKKIGLSFKETQPLITLYLKAEDVANLDSIVANEVNKNYSTFMNKAVYPISSDEKSLTADWMKSCFYEVFADEISKIKAWAPTEIQKHNEREKGFGGVVNVVKEKASGVISTVKDKAEDIVSIVKNKSEDSTSTIKEKSNEVKNYVVPKLKTVKEKASTVINNGKRKLKGR